MKKAALLSLAFVFAFSLALSGCGTVAPDPGESSGPAGSEVVVINGRAEYMTFDESLSAATDIVAAVYTGEYERHGVYYDSTFTPVEWLKGTDTQGDIRVRTCDMTVDVTDAGIRYKTKANDYVQGAKYVLVLSKTISVYLPYDVYLPMNNIMIEYGETPTMYNDSFVGDFSESEPESEDTSGVINYIEEFLLSGEDVSRVTGYDFIRSDDIAEVVSGSSVVAEVVPEELTGSSDNNDTERYLCSVRDVLKGTVDGESINIIFIADSVEPGSEYLVMLEQAGDSGYYILSSKISVCGSGDESFEDVKDILRGSAQDS